MCSVEESGPPTMGRAVLERRQQSTFKLFTLTIEHLILHSTACWSDKHASTVTVRQTDARSHLARGDLGAPVPQIGGGRRKLDG